MPLIKFLKRSSLFAGLLYAVMALTPSPAAAHETPGSGEDQARARLITTTGVGEVRIRPDALRVVVGVQAQAQTVEQAQNEVNTRMARVLQAIRNLRIAGLVLQTETLSIFPVYAPHEGNELPRIVGYRASNNVSVTVRGPAPENLGAQASRIVGAAVGAGANALGGISFFASDLRDAEQRSLREAVNDAQRNARTMADAAGVALGPLTALNGAPERGGRQFSGMALREAAFDAPAPIETGEIVVTSRVTASFSIQPRR